MSWQPAALAEAAELVDVPYTVRPTRAPAGSAATRPVTAFLAASMRGPGASACFIEPEASSTTMTGVDSPGRAGAGAWAARAGAAAATSAATARMPSPARPIDDIAPPPR